MLTIIISLLISIGQITSAEEFYELPPQEQQELIIIGEDLVM